QVRLPGLHRRGPVRPEDAACSSSSGAWLVEEQAHRPDRANVEAREAEGVEYRVARGAPAEDSGGGIDPQRAAGEYEIGHGDVVALDETAPSTPHGARADDELSGDRRRGIDRLGGDAQAGGACPAPPAAVLDLVCL